MFRRRAARSSADWTPVSIHIVEARRPSLQRDGISSTIFDAAVDLVFDRSTAYRFVLDVRPAGGAPYRLEVEENVPRSVVAPGLRMEEKIPSGIDVSGWVHVGNPQNVQIDWTTYKGTPAAKAKVQSARQAETDETYARTVLAKASPKQQQKLRDAGWATVSGQAEAVRHGALTREQWEESAQLHLRRTLITPEQYEAAARLIDGP